jgi:hypothetical protein
VVDTRTREGLIPEKRRDNELKREREREREREKRKEKKSNEK